MVPRRRIPILSMFPTLALPSLMPKTLKRGQIKFSLGRSAFLCGLCGGPLIFLGALCVHCGETVFDSLKLMTTPNWDNHSRAQASRQWRKQSAIMGQNVTEAIVAAAQVEPGMSVLDVACGSGEPAISIATLLNGSGEVIGVDLSQGALQIATER